ncbi:THAP domain-containing protein 5-like isoform X2 [Leptidea sinapis]|uniref:THAP domain-containing protein 5-like isoform X2 n=1 Tax=Leptidea sinapis TaxID=189913 RepID=UPI0021C3A1F7|nr:THAP domain-containing protein 5-like isoform X2 [Leptidea sinapis]
MPSCVVRKCKNNTTVQKKCQGITFHRFPVGNEPWKNDWVQIIRDCRREEDWIPSKSSVVCSVHFDENDLYTTGKGRRRLVTYSVPKLLLFGLPVKKEQTAKPGPTGSSLDNDQKEQMSLESDQEWAGLPVKEEQPDEPGTTSSSLDYDQKEQMSFESDQECAGLLVKEEQPAEPGTTNSSLDHDQKEQVSLESDQEWAGLPVKEEQLAEPGTTSSSLDYDQKEQMSFESDQECAGLPVKEEQPAELGTTKNSLDHDQKEQMSLESDQAPQPYIIITIDPEQPSGLCTPLSSSQIPPAPTNGFEDCEQPSLWDSPRNLRLKKIIKKQDILLETQRKKIKTLNQKVRRLRKRNQFLKDILKK